MIRMSFILLAMTFLNVESHGQQQSNNGLASIIRNTNLPFQSIRPVLYVDFLGNGKKYRVYYGKFYKDVKYTRNNKFYEIRDFINGSTSGINKNEYGLIIYQYNNIGKAIVFPSGDLDSVSVIKNSLPRNECWNSQEKKEGLAISRDGVGGTLYYQNSWRWKQCGD